jgi:hypothetical protein
MSQTQTSDNSRTFRVLNLTDEVKSDVVKMNVVVTQHENVHYVEVASMEDIASVRKLFDDSEIKYKQCSYSTFVRFKDTLSQDDLKAAALELAENVNILYSRVDENNHTGKLVVDRLEDYNKLKNSTGDINFYRFSPLNVPRVQNRNYQGREGGEQNGEWQTVQRNNTRQSTVRGQYTQQPVQQSGGRRAEGGQSSGGRGGARGGRGGARGGAGGPYRDAAVRGAGGAGRSA